MAGGGVAEDEGKTTAEWRPTVNPWLVAAAVMLPTFMEILDTTIVSVALPHIAGSLSASTDEATWTLTSYLVANAVILPATGWFARYFGRSRFLVYCIIIFTVASFACGMAESLGMLIVARVIQGAGGGALQPISQAILLESFPPQKRGMAMAAFGVGVVVAPIIGPTLGGWLTDQYSWRWAFFMNLPVGILAVFMTRAFVEDPPYIKTARPGKIDNIGFGLMAVSLATLQITLDKGQQDDWFSASWVRWFVAISLVTLVLFIIRELRTKEPVVNLRVLKDRNFAVGTLLIALLGVCLYSAITLIPIYLQTLMGYTAMLSGLTLSPRGLGAIVTMPVVGFLTGKVDFRKIIGTGFILVAISLWQLGGINLEISMWNIVWPNILMGAGLSMIFVPLSAVAMGMLPSEQMGNASGIFNLMRNLGGSAGISAVTTILERRAQVHQSDMISHLAPGDPAFQIHAHGLRQAFGQYFPPAEALRKADGTIYNELIRQSTLLAFMDNFRLLAFLSMLCVVAVMLLKRVKPKGTVSVH
jgi:MFS transporter, DHA2 family, multidrug resistance protein